MLEDLWYDFYQLLPSKRWACKWCKELVPRDARAHHLKDRHPEKWQLFMAAVMRLTPLRRALPAA